MTNQTDKWTVIPGGKYLPDRREVIPVGRIYLPDIKKLLTVEETKNYIKAL